MVWTQDERVTRGSERTLRWKGRAARLPSGRRPRCAQRMGSPGSAPAVTWTWPCHGRTAAPTPLARGCVWRHSSRGSSRSNGVTGRGASPRAAGPLDADIGTQTCTEGRPRGDTGSTCHPHTPPRRGAAGGATAHTRVPGSGLRDGAQGASAACCDGGPRALTGPQGCRGAGCDPEPRPHDTHRTGPSGVGRGAVRPVWPLTEFQAGARALQPGP